MAYGLRSRMLQPGSPASRHSVGMERAGCADEQTRPSWPPAWTDRLSSWPAHHRSAWSPALYFRLRFDFRNSGFAGTPMVDRYGAGLDMAAWADSLGTLSISLAEHHGSVDGYLPRPMLVRAAMAARTSHVRFMIAALVAPFHDPLRLSEDVVVLDHIS